MLNRANRSRCVLKMLTFLIVICEHLLVKGIFRFHNIINILILPVVINLYIESLSFVLKVRVKLEFYFNTNSCFASSIFTTLHFSFSPQPKFLIFFFHSFYFCFRKLDARSAFIEWSMCLLSSITNLSGIYAFFSIVSVYSSLARGYLLAMQ